MESSIVDFYRDLYITAINKLSLQLPHVHILGMHHCGNMSREAFKHNSDFQDVLYCRDYEERVIAIFVHRIQYEYYGGNRSVSIEGIALEHFK